MKTIALGLCALVLGCGNAVGEEPVDDAAPVVRDSIAIDTREPDPIDTAVVVEDTAKVDATPACDVPGALLCEDFESGKIDPAKWTKELKNATLAVETGRAARGKYALHLRVEGPKVDMPNEASLHERLVLPLTSNKFFVRMMVFVEKDLPDKNFILAEARGALPDGTPARYGVGGMNPAGEGQLFRLVYHPGDFVAKSTSHPPVGRWSCWEFQMDGANDAMRVWIDGGATPEARAIDEKPPWNAPAFKDLALGFRIPHPDSRAMYDVWIDEIVIGTTRPGCPK